MKRLASILVLMAACSSQPQEQPQSNKTSLVQQVPKGEVVTKYYAELSQLDLDNLTKCKALRLNLKGVNGAHGFRVFIGTEYPQLGLSNPFNEIHYVASISFYPIGIKDSNFTLDVKPTLLDLIQEGGLIQAGKIPVVLEPQAFHQSDILAPITVNVVEFEAVR